MILTHPTQAHTLVPLLILILIKSFQILTPNSKRPLFLPLCLKFCFRLNIIESKLTQKKKIESKLKINKTKEKS